MYGFYPEYAIYCLFFPFILIKVIQIILLNHFYYYPNNRVISISIFFTTCYSMMTYYQPDLVFSILASLFMSLINEII